jgi:hypothetical protein
MLTLSASFWRWPLGVLVFVASAMAMRSWLAVPPPERSEPRVTSSSPGGDAIPDVVTRRCAHCHSIPSPDVLPKSGWRTFLAMKRKILTKYVADRGLDAGLVVPLDDLEQATAHYVASSPTQDELIGPPVIFREDAGLFETVARRALQAGSSAQGYVDVLVDADARVLVLSDYFGERLHLVDFTGAERGFVGLGGRPARLVRTGASLLVALMDGPGDGQILRVALDVHEPSRATVQPIIQGLERPIRAYPADVLGASGLLVEEFASHTGSLKFFPQNDDGDFGPPRALVHPWGTVASTLADLDGDGRKDLIVLVSQEIEQLLVIPGIEAPYAEVPEPTILFQGHPGFGFNGLLVLDVDADGRPDLVTLNGDNYDVGSGSLKPYHGIRIFMNQGGLQFAEPLFLPLHGIVGVLPGDFDGDGRVDLLALSVFPDHRVLPYQSAVLFQQSQPMVFVPRGIEAARGNRWIAAATIDNEGNGGPDLVLVGAYTAINEADERWSELAGPDAATLMLLRNRGGR